MRSQIAAFDEARSSLHRLGLPANLPKLHAAGVGISRSVLGGSHSVAIYPPLYSLLKVSPNEVIDSVTFAREVSLYIHIAYCETRCTFCHYVVNHYAGKGKGSKTRDAEVEDYLRALHQELQFWGAKLAQSTTSVSSIYIGGGTPLLLDQDALRNLLSTIQSAFTVLPGAEVCIEGSPLTITSPGGEGKLRFLREEGVTRLSFGVQSFDDTVLKYAGRGYKRDVPIQASLVVNRVFENWNLDLIQGLYKGSPLEVWRNLEAISEIRPPHLTWYHGRFADRPQGSWYNSASKRSSFEDETATLLGRLLIWQEMAALGYRQSDGNRFVRNQQYVDPFKKIRTSASSDLLGLGVASYSHSGTRVSTANSRGYMFRNVPTIRSYVDTVLAGDAPIATGRVIDEEELLAASYATGLRNGRIEDEDLRSIRGKRYELSTHYQNLETSLRDLGILESYMDDNGRSGTRISELGKLFEDEVLALFFSPAVKKAVAGQVAT